MKKQTNKKTDEKVFTIKTRVVLKPEYSNNANILPPQCWEMIEDANI